MAVIEHVLSVRDMGSDVIRAFKDEVSGAVGETNELTKTLALMGGAAIGVGTAYFAMTKEIADFKNEILDAGTATGLQVSTLQGLDLAARGSGQSLGTLTGALRPFSKRLLDASKGTGEALAGFKALGIESTKLDGSLRSTDDVLKEATAKLAAIEDPTLKAALATQLFGEAGTSLLVALGDAPLEDFIADAERLGPSFEDGAQGAADMQRAIAALELASLGAADAFAQSFGGEEGLAGLINSVADDVVVLGAVLGNFFAGIAADMGALFDSYTSAIQTLRSGDIGQGLLELGAAAGQGFVTTLDPTRALDVARDVQDQSRIQEFEALKALQVANGNETVTLAEGFELELSSVAESGERKRTKAASDGAKERERIARDEERARLQSQRELERLAQDEARRRDAAQSAQTRRILDQAATFQSQAAATMGAQSSLSDALAFSDPFSSAAAGFRGADAFQANLTDQFSSGLGGIDASGDIAGAANLQRFNAAVGLGASVMQQFAGLTAQAGQVMGSFLTGDALGGFQGALGGIGQAGAGAIRSGTQAAGAVAAVAGGPYGAIIGAGIQVVGDKIADKFDGFFGQISQALGVITGVGRLGVGGVEQNLKTFERDFFAGLEALPTILGEVLPRFADSFADQFAEHFPDFAQDMTREFVEHAPEIGLALAMGFIEGMVQATKSVGEDALSGSFRDSFGSGGRGGRDGFNARDYFAPLFGGGMQRGRDTSGGFLGGLSDRGGAMAREGRLGGRREQVVRLDGPGANFYRDLVRQLNAQLGNQGVRLALGGQ